MPPRINLSNTTRIISYRPRTTTRRWSYGVVVTLPRWLSSSTTLPMTREKCIYKTKDIQIPGDERINAFLHEKIARRSFYSSSIRFQDASRTPQHENGDGELAEMPATTMEETMEENQHMEAPEGPGLKFDPVPLPFPARYTPKRRYDPVIEQLTGLLMRDGKKGVAQRNIALILTHLRTSPPPKLRADRPLVPGHPPPSYLPLNPTMYLTLAIDSIAPVLRLRTERGAAGGGASVLVPIPLASRQRRRTAIAWIIDAASKKRSRTSGKGMFAHRVAEEIVAIVEGRSSLWEKRVQLHKQGVANRTNVNFKRRK